MKVKVTYSVCGENHESIVESLNSLLKTGLYAINNQLDAEDADVRLLLHDFVVER